MKRSDTIIEKNEGSVTFVVDRYLPAPERHLEHLVKGQEAAEYILRKRSISGVVPDVLAISCPEAELYVPGQDVFFQTLVMAFAGHHPVVISPDMIWILICQGFSNHIIQNPEIFRERMVNHQGKKQLEVNTSGSEFPSAAEWVDIVNRFTEQIKENARDGLASVLLSNYSTTGPAERIASRITFLDTVKPFFEYIVRRMICGIPYITLKGTPEDWEKMISKVELLSQFEFEWWTSRLIPILNEFVETAKGKPKVTFWRNIVKTWHPNELRGRGCSPWGPSPSKINGWFLRFFPYYRNGRTPDSVNYGDTMLPETVSVTFKYRISDDSDQISEEIPMNLTAGFIGIEEDIKTYALTPKIAWFISQT